MHKNYEIKFGHNADFKVSYKFYSLNEGGRQKPPFQGYRSDFWYDNPEHSENQVFMIWPEFEDENANIITDTNKPIADNGTARMWILIPKMRSHHKHKIKIG